PPGLVRGVATAPHVLEVGIGTGRIAVPLAERGVRVTGIDVSAKMLAILREKRGDIGVAFAEASRLPFRGGSFDAALFVHILHLVPDIGATVAAALGVLRPGGLLLSAGEGRRVGRETEMSDMLDAIINRHVPVRDPEVQFAHGRRLSRKLVEARGGTMEEAPLASWEYRTTPREVLGKLERKEHSGSWHIPDEAIARIVGEAEGGLAEMFGGLDAEVGFERSFSVTVGRRP
ncbi:MAG: class I SAM-dependent methyltransferase, partial [Dehalococcoidia bacterium]